MMVAVAGGSRVARIPIIAEKVCSRALVPSEEHLSCRVQILAHSFRLLIKSTALSIMSRVLVNLLLGFLLLENLLHQGRNLKLKSYRLLQNFSDTLLSLISIVNYISFCLLYTSPSPRDLSTSRMPSSA